MRNCCLLVKCQELHKLAVSVMQCFAIALKVPESAQGRHFFDQSHVWEESSGTTLRFLHYPQQSGDPSTPLAGRYMHKSHFFGCCTIVDPHGHFVDQRQNFLSNHI